jgi:sugar phosphate isomerase/epimerase
VRAEAVELPGLDQAIARWRNTVDQTVLSVHLPNIYWNDGEQSEAERNLWIKTTQAANDLNTAQMTLHPPRLPMDVYRQDPDVIQRLADRVQPYLEKTTARIAVENLHMSPNQTVENREFGCLPDEVLSWREAIRERLGSQRVGNLLDLGHARANGPYSSTVGLGTWFTHLGTDIIGYHLHQLDPQSGAKRCHFPIDHIYGPGISYAAYFWAWQTGQISRCPIFLEVRGAEQRIASLQYLRRVLTENPV